jgi:hypothetical protein
VVTHLLQCLTVILLVAPATARAQCYPLQATPDALGYRYRSNRCEGLYNSNVSSGDGLQVVSLLAGELNFSLAPTVVLEVSPVTDFHSAINVRAVPLPIKTYYRMDATIQHGDTLLWPVADVLYRIRLPSTRLGVYGWYGAEDDKTFVPLLVSPKGTGARAGQIVLGVRPSVDINKAVNWRWSGFEGGGCSGYGAWQTTATTYSNGVNMLKIPISSINNNYFCMEVKAKEGNTGNWLPSLIVKIRRA